VPKQRIDGPLCITCGKMLRPRRTAKGFQSEEEAREFARLMDPDRHPRVTVGRESWRENVAEVSYQVGWGLNDRFCSQPCGFFWAVRHSKPAQHRKEGSE